MLLLVCHGHPTMVRFAHPNLGRLVQPRHFSSIEETAATGVPWAADNDCFNGFDEDRFIAMLDRITGLVGCKFVTAPDVVADADATLELYPQWRDEIAQRNLPVAFVGQDGITPGRVPWDELDAFFIGGTTEWKLGEEAARLARAAKALGKWVHMGRVNSLKRIRYAASLGCDSIDGTKYARFVNTHLERGLWEVAGAEGTLF